MDYKKINKAAWNIKTGIHISSDFYDQQSFLEGKSTLNDIEIQLLDDIQGKTVLHLQCHFGQDTISLSRMGAKVTGIDLSDKAIDTARNIATQLGVDTRFVCSDIYDLPNVLDEKFDIVFTSYGVIGWLPDMRKWAQTVSHFLKPGGTFVMVEFHPIAWMFDDDFTNIAYGYFNSGEFVEKMQGSYADREADVEYTTISWNHTLSDVINNLIQSGIQINSFEEFDYSPFNCFKNMVEISEGKFQIKGLGNKMPLLYSLKGTKIK